MRPSLATDNGFCCRRAETTLHGKCITTTPTADPAGADTDRVISDALTGLKAASD